MKTIPIQATHMNAWRRILAAAKHLAALTLITLGLQACHRPEQPLCSTPTRAGTLPATLSEASGVAVSLQHPGLLWTHEDSDHPPIISAIDTTGRLLGRVRVVGARNYDWEDLSLGPCPTGSCIYLADTGDNLLRRQESVIYRIPEPAPDDTLSTPAESFPVRFPNGPRDVEALFILPDGTLYLISKGRRHPVELYRYPPPLREGEVVELEEVQRLTAQGVPLPDQVTGADISPDGRWIAVRSYSWVQLYRFDGDGRLQPALDPPGLSLQSLAEPQGEGVTIRDDGTLFLISESGPIGVPGIVGRVECRAPGMDAAPNRR